MKLLLQYLSRYKGLIALSLLLAAVNQVFSLFDPYILGHYLIDPFASHPKNWTQEQFINGILKGLLMLVGTAMVSRIAKAFQDYTVNVVIQKFGARLYSDGLKHALRLPYQDFEDQRSGETLSILQKVRSDCEKFINAFVNILFATLVGLVFVMVYAIMLNSVIALIYLAGALILSTLMYFLSKKIKFIQRSILKETNSLAGSTTESLRNIELVKSLGLTQQEIHRLNATTIKILTLELRKVKSLRALSFIQGTVVNALRQCIMFALLYLIFKDKLTLGQMMTMQFYSFFIFGPLQELGNIIIAYREAEASLTNMQTLFQKPVEYTPQNPELLGSIERLRFDNVSFQHNTAVRPALEQISFEVKLGDTVAFVGPSGSGKTTLVKLLVGLYHPNTGGIYYNNHDGLKIDFDEFRRQLGFVTQDTQLFSGTIKENLLFVNPGASDEQINDALKKAMSTSKRAMAAVNPLVETRDVIKMKNKTGNLYESITVVSRRASQIAVNMKEELHRKLDEFSTHGDNLEEIHENKEQIEISRIYERMANPALQALTEFNEDKIYHRKK